jgi:hypothetical protein
VQAHSPSGNAQFAPNQRVHASLVAFKVWGVEAATEVAGGRITESQSILALVSARIEAFEEAPVGFLFGAFEEQLE